MKDIKYSIKLSTGENIPMDTIEQVQEIMHLRAVYMGKLDNTNTIPLPVTEGGAIAHILPQFIMGYVEFAGTHLSTIVEQAQETQGMVRSMREEMAEIAEANLMDATVD